MWTDYEKLQLVKLYPNHSDKELCNILRKTSGQLRGMKERLGLNAKQDLFTDKEKEIITNYYNEHPLEIDLSDLSKMLGRPKTSIARWAGSQGLTKSNRPVTESAKIKSMASASAYRQTEYYKNVVLPRQTALLAFYAQNQHPRGMLGKHHTSGTTERMSDEHKRIWNNMNESERKELVFRMRAGKIRSGTYRSTRNTYSRCRGGYREDLDMYFRSSWEANVARILNNLELAWEYEPKRFYFPDTGDGVLSYCPDFYIPDADIWIEVKGWMDEKSITRLRKFSESYPFESSRLIVINEPLYLDMIKRFYGLVSNLEIIK